MWSVYLASNSVAENVTKNRPSVVRAFLNARYYNSAQGQFISQDPVFWGKQNIADPQSLNAYSYAEDNPINRSDPSGNASLSGLLQQLAGALRSLLSALGSRGSASGVQTNLSSTASPNTSAGNITQAASGWVTQKTPTGCLIACEDMAGYKPNPNHAIITSRLENGKLVTQTDAKEGIQTIDEYLATRGRGYSRRELEWRY